MLNPYSCQVKRRGPLKKRLLWQYTLVRWTTTALNPTEESSAVSRVSTLNYILERGLRGGAQPNMNQKLFLEPPTPSPCLRLCQMGYKKFSRRRSTHNRRAGESRQKKSPTGINPIGDFEESNLELHIKHDKHPVLIFSRVGTRGPTTTIQKTVSNRSEITRETSYDLGISIIFMNQGYIDFFSQGVAH